MASAADTRLNIEVIDGLWVVKIAKGWLALTRDEVKASLQRGKRLRRRLQFRARHPKEDA
jgi:hypothetical protein